MHRYTESRTLPHSPEQMFNLVVNIVRYPEFLPWCRAARILSHEKDGAFLGELVISFSHLSERYTSRVTPVHASADAPARIDVSLVSGPFNHLTNHWRFLNHPDGCEIQLELSFEFKSKILDRLMGSLFERACAKMVSAFTARAEALYGTKSG
jgi:coenzyme Q-binding protein COQ10